MNLTAFHGKLKGKGHRYHICPSCGRTMDLDRDRCWLGNGGWWCSPCAKAQREPKEGIKKEEPINAGQNFSDR
jgi:ribosomal protein L37AE/L43A